MRKADWLLLVITALLTVSLTIPSYTYSPPYAGFFKGTIETYDGPPRWVGYVECTADTSSYYSYVVNWTLSYPHDYGVSKPGMFKTTVLVRNWSRFFEEIPSGCYVLGRDSLSYDDKLYRASERLKNLTAGTPDYEKLEPFFDFAGSPETPVNVTWVKVTVFFTGMMEPVKLPFVAIWLGILIVSVAGIIVSHRRSKALLAVFLITLLLSALFLRDYLQMERKISGTAEAFNELLALNSTGGWCTEIGGAQGDFSSREDVNWFLKTVKENNATIGSVRWEDTVLRIHVKVNMNNYKRIIDAFKERGWETSVIDSESLNALLEERHGTREINETLTTLEKYLPYLTPDERKAVEDYMADLKETLHQDRDQKNLCIAVFATSPEAIIPDYGGYSDFLAKFALVAVFVGLALGRRRGNETR
ncbi:hypothetical protein E3E28_07030 [Thermococcus sp. 21S9]|nr:hypothetical protein [Thermococcus sp. 21S9]